MAIAQNNEDAEKIYQMGFENTTAFDSDEQRGAITGINRKRMYVKQSEGVPASLEVGAPGIAFLINQASGYND
jgi:hypothetical protein